MCRLFAFSFTENTGQQEKIEYLNYFRSLSVTGNVLDTSSPGHMDGWGVVVYKDNQNLPLLHKSVSSALDDIDFVPTSFLTERSNESGLMHLRKKTVGEVSVHNSHPFTEGKYAFIHNGTIRRDGETYSFLSSKCNGSTDSERIFRRFLDIQEQGNLPVLEAFTKMINETKVLCPMYSAINTILHDGEALYVSRVINKENKAYEYSLLENYYTLYVGVTKNNDIVISSEKKDDDGVVYTLLPNESVSKITLKDNSIETNFLL